MESLCLWPCPCRHNSVCVVLVFRYRKRSPSKGRDSLFPNLSVTNQVTKSVFAGKWCKPSRREWLPVMGHRQRNQLLPQTNGMVPAYIRIANTKHLYPPQSPRNQIKFLLFFSTLPSYLSWLFIWFPSLCSFLFPMFPFMCPIYFLLLLNFSLLFSSLFPLSTFIPITFRPFLSLIYTKFDF